MHYTRYIALILAFVSAPLSLAIGHIKPLLKDAAASYPLDREYRVRLNVTVPAGGRSWYVIR